MLGLNTVVATFFQKQSQSFSVQANQLVTLTALAAGIIVSFLFEWHLGLFIIALSFWMMSEYELLGRKRYKEYALVNISTRGAQLVIGLLLYYYLGLWGIIVGFSIPYLVFSYRYFLSIKSFSFRRFDEIRKGWHFIGHAYSFNLSNAFLMYFDKLLIAPLFGHAILGNYQLALQFLLFIGMIPISFYQYLISQGSISEQHKNRVHYLGIMISLVVALSIFFASSLVVLNVFPNFVESIYAIRIASFGIVPMMVASGLNSKFFTAMRSRFVLIGSLIYLSTQSILVIILGTAWAVNGLAVSIVCALTAQAVFLYAANIHFERTKCKGIVSDRTEGMGKSDNTRNGR